VAHGCYVVETSTDYNKDTQLGHPVKTEDSVCRVARCERTALFTRHVQVQQA